MKKPCGSLVVARAPAGSSATICAMSAAPSVLASTTMRRRPFSRRIWFGPSVSRISAICRAGIQPDGRLDQQVAEPLRGPRLGPAGASRRRSGGSHRRRCETTRPFESRLELLDHGRRLHAVERRARRSRRGSRAAECAPASRPAGRPGPGCSRAAAAGRSASAAQRVEVVAEDLERDLRRARPTACGRAGARSAGRR